MQRYGQYCPLARGAEVLGDRWTLLIIREMLFGVRRQVPTWFAWSGFAPAVREGMAQRTANPRPGRA
jgi:hypothetical protein